jgi:16S rRNA (uracil1498-N3)-methyltransferase
MPAMPHRFLAPDATAAGRVVELPAGEAAHLARVLRLGTGDRVVVFDGRGRQFAATVETVKPAVRVRLAEAVAAAPEPRVRLTLVQAVLKGDGMDGVVRDAVMLGAATIQPVVSTRTEVTVQTLHRGRRIERWERVALASVKQCGRALVPDIGEPLAMEAALGSVDVAQRLILVEPSASAERRPSLAAAAPAPVSAALLVGPEGGWTPGELEAAATHGWVPLTLGGRTLRADAAAIVAISALWGAWGEF